MQINIDIKWGRKDRVLIAMLEGRFDGRNADVFEQLLDLGIDPGDEALILDFEHVTFFSSAGLRVGLRMAKRFGEPGKRFAICALPDSVRDIVKVSGFDKIITIYDTQASAVEAVGNG
jgi:anti-anti-sigma factor